MRDDFGGKDEDEDEREEERMMLFKFLWDLKMRSSPGRSGSMVRPEISNDLRVLQVASKYLPSCTSDITNDLETFPPLSPLKTSETRFGPRRDRSLDFRNNRAAMGQAASTARCLSPRDEKCKSRRFHLLPATSFPSSLRSSLHSRAFRLFQKQRRR